MDAFLTYLQNPMVWYGFAVVLGLIELFGLTGIGFAFLALGALGTGLGIHLFAVQEPSSIFMLFTSLSLFFAAVLWKPLKRLYNHSDDPITHMVGDEVVVTGGDLVKGHIGKARWSGTEMRARLADDASKDRIKIGDRAIIHEVVGTTLVVDAPTK